MLMMAEASSLESVTVIKSREHVYVFYFSTSLCLNARYMYTSMSHECMSAG